MNESREMRRGFLAAVLSMIWMVPCAQFWLAVWGPLRPHGYPEGTLGPSGPVFLSALLASAAASSLPDGYFRIRSFESDGQLYEVLGVHWFRWLVPDGDFVRAWQRRVDPGYRVLRGRQDAVDFVSRTRVGERMHLVLLLFGVVSSIYAWHLGWRGWATVLVVGNVLVNLYPILLQRYTRARLVRILSRGGGHRGA